MCSAVRTSPATAPASGSRVDLRTGLRPHPFWLGRDARRHPLRPGVLGVSSRAPRPPHHRRRRLLPRGRARPRDDVPAVCTGGLPVSGRAGAAPAPGGRRVRAALPVRLVSLLRRKQAAAGPDAHAAALRREAVLLRAGRRRGRLGRGRGRARERDAKYLHITLQIRGSSTTRRAAAPHNSMRSWSAPRSSASPSSRHGGRSSYAGSGGAAGASDASSSSVGAGAAAKKASSVDVGPSS